MKKNLKRYKITLRDKNNNVKIVEYSAKDGAEALKYALRKNKSLMFDRVEELS